MTLGRGEALYGNSTSNKEIRKKLSKVLKGLQFLKGQARF